MVQTASVKSKYRTHTVFLPPSVTLPDIRLENANSSRLVAYPGIQNTELTALSLSERTILTVIVSTLCLLSVCGNLSTLYMNMRRRRKIRPFFRSCLISLAFSDLCNTIALTLAYLFQYHAKYVQIWNMGPAMCSLLPFATTTAILASSMTLVGIGLDRYFAVMKAVIGFWNPSVTFSVVCMLVLWASSIGIASPVLWIYTLTSVYIMSNSPDSTTPEAAGDSKGTDKSQFIVLDTDELVQMCTSDQGDVSLYYVIVFGIIFIPCIVAFVWLNTIIANKLWIRRHSASRMRKRTKRLFASSSEPAPNNAELLVDGAENPNCSCQNGHASIPMPSSRPQADEPLPSPPPPVATTQPPALNTARETRHIRMFTIILLMMTVFLFFRLPAWIFMIMRMYGNYTRPAHWILYFSFGILNLASCVLNPLFYTFLTQTIQCALFVKVKLWDGFCQWRPECSQAPSPAATEGDLCCIATFCGCFARGSSNNEPNGGPPAVQHESCDSSWTSKAVEHAVAEVFNEDRDEGVECGGDASEDDDDNAAELLEFNQRIYTIFPSSLVSSSKGSS